jgi:hypothetical protein
MSFIFAATDIALPSLLGNATMPFLLTTGTAELLGLIIIIAAAWLAVSKGIGLPAVAMGAALLLGIMAAFGYIDTTVVYAALIVMGIVGGVGVARWLGIV